MCSVDTHRLASPSATRMLWSPWGKWLERKLKPCNLNSEFHSLEEEEENQLSKDQWLYFWRPDEIRGMRSMCSCCVAQSAVAEAKLLFKIRNEKAKKIRMQLLQWCQDLVWVVLGYIKITLSTETSSFEQKQMECAATQPFYRSDRASTKILIINFCRGLSKPLIWKNSMGT